MTSGERYDALTDVEALEDLKRQQSPATAPESICVCGQSWREHFGFTKCPFQDGFFRARLPGRPIQPFKCTKCEEVMSKKAVRSHKCPVLG